MATRKERDSLGERELPEEAYYGVNALRAVENFPVSGLKASPYLIKAYALVKQAAAEANSALGAVEKEKAEAIAKAAAEIVNGKFHDQFIVDVFQAGAGTSTNMNFNEVIANRALELLAKKKGDYAFISPNDHVNRGQSTNDTFPTILNLSILLAFKDLEKSSKILVESLRKKEKEFAKIPKSGRTHLKDAMPVTLGEEFGSYASAIERILEGLPRVREGLCELALGGTAVGTGVNSLPGYRRKSVERLAKLSGFPLKASRDPFETMNSRWAGLAASQLLKSLAVELSRISNDLRLLSSGPASGLDEIRLPEVQSGSSIMPAKVNPSMGECLNQICFHIIGSDFAVTMAAEAGQLEINVMMPVMAFETLFSATLLINFLPAFASKCIDGVTVNVEKCEGYLLASTSLATVLTPKLGYLKVAEVIKKAMAKNENVKNYLVREGILAEKEAEEILGREALLKITKPVE
jgi:aspartate ammonia-lyase